MKRKCYFFANDNDYNMFTSFLKEVTTILIDTKPLLINESINPLKNISEAQSIQLCLLNTNIVSLAEYSKEYNNIQGYAHFHPIGRGRIQLLKSTIEKGKFLKNGQLYGFSEDEDSEAWIKEVFSWIKRHSKKVYRTTLNRNTISEHPEPNYYCFPSASEEFNGEEGKFLTIANDVYCIAK